MEINEYGRDIYDLSDFLLAEIVIEACSQVMSSSGYMKLVV